MAKTILHTQNLSIGYRNKKHLQPIASLIDIDLKEGKLIALIGANGIGKSTLLRTLTGIQEPLSGSVFLGQRPLENYSQTALAKQLSVVLTEKLPPSNLTVFELVALGRQPYTNWIGTLSPDDLTKTNAVMALTQIENFASKKHFEISDGQLQKVLIARALAQDTPLIILDEPTTHLDLLHKVSLFRLLRKLTRETGKCILFSTHDIDLAMELADEMIVMTAQQTFQDSPCVLIEKGVFNHLFADEHLSFDAKKGKFVFKNL
ncbi:MAG TPA: ABC transporter ATP-binding protein [Flavobacterium sp.]|jgi:iron complex transport system ATP-binding protein|nr:ABC transporter ATP-binding protein [Flavobacterium sp.]HPJ11297.1 ABC transporter ATP-binding protein [Flavobacterium sp.]